MKLLRILTGMHAGAQLRLDQGAHVVGNDTDADVHITDWKHASIRLTIEEGMPVALASLTTEGGTPLEMPALEDLLPRRFKDIVLCVGPADADWPSDIKLLEKLVRADARPAKPKKKLLASRQTVMMSVGAALSVAMLSAFAMVVSRGRDKSEPALPLQAQVQRAVQTIGAPGITVRASEGRVLVEGLVADGSSAARLRAALRPFDAASVMHRYASAEDLAQSMTDALATPGVSVRYRGDGVFLVDGRAIDLDRLRAEARRVAADLGPLVQRIDFAVAEMPPPERIPIGSMLSSEDIRYVQTRDGTKHLFVGQPPQAEATNVFPPKTH